MKDSLRYTNLQVSIHWITVILVTVAILLPFCRSLFSSVAFVFMVHKSLGVSVFILTVIRIVVVKKQGAPELFDSSQRIHRILSKSTQGLLYLLLIIMPISGYLMSAKSIDFFGLLSIPGITLPIELHSDMRSLHLFSAHLLILLIGIHALIALYQHFRVKDSMIRAMWFSNKNNRESN